MSGEIVMERTTGGLGIGGFGFYIAVVFCAIAAWGTQSWMSSLAQRQLIEKAPASGIYGEAVPVTQLTDIQQRQLDAYLEVNRLLTTLGTTLLGALGFLLFGQQKAGAWTKHWWAAFLGAFFVAVSIFFGYVAYSFVVQQLQNLAQPFEPNPTLDLISSSPHWAQQAHFYTFLAGVVFLADFVFHNLTKHNLTRKES
jgi:hypothetical protein